MTPADDRSPPRPVMAFQVGLTGHRALPGADDAALRTAAAGLLRDLAGAVRNLHAADRVAAVPLHAPDPPALRCICGLAEGADTMLAEVALAEGWSLVAVLPFAQPEFERDFATGPALDRFRVLLAQAGTVCELDGARSRGGEPYAAVGEVIVEQSDVLLAVWDGLPPRGPGGTGDVVQRALTRGLPVAVLPPTDAAGPAWHGTEGVAAAVGAALLAPHDPAGFPQAYLQERVRGAGWAGHVVRLFERAMLLGAGAAVPPSGDAPPQADTALLRFFLPADRLAAAHAARYRAAGLLRYALILPATLGAFVGFYGSLWQQAPGFLLQFAALVAMLVFSARGWWEDAQRRFVAFRALAEHLRNARLLLPLGAVPVLPGTPAHQGRAADWTVWYARAAIREAGLRPGRLDGPAMAAVAAFVRAEAEAELDFLHGRAARFTTIARRLRRVGVVLFLAGVACAALRAVLILDGAGSGPMLLMNEVALVLPAMAPVFLGLLGFGEYGRLATRYRAVAAALEGQVAALEGATARPGVLRVARRIADVMLAEGADWQLIIKDRTVSAY